MEEENYYINLEKLYVHNVYENISTQYDAFFKQALINSSLNSKKQTNETNSCTESKPEQQKYKAWPKVSKFLLSLEPDCLVADIGCGEGKYLNINSKLVTIGCDRSSSLCHLASAQKPAYNTLINSNQVLICDNLSLPFRSNLFDAVISIGVIHHFSSMNRRVKAVQELSRILRPGGKIMIYVWAMEQRLRKFEGQDVLVPLMNTCPTGLPLRTQNSLRRALSNNSESECEATTSKETQYKWQPRNQSTLSLNKLNHRNIENLKIQSEKVPSSSEDNLKKNIFLNIRGYLFEKFNSGLIKSQDNVDEIDKISKLKNSKQNSTEQEIDFYEKCKLIMDEYKGKLPKNFSIRKFPFSSYENTFDDDDEDDINKSKLIDSTFHIACPDRTDPSQVGEPLEAVSQCESETSKSDEPAYKENISNKRFYHVFKKDELNEMIAEYCNDLDIYDTYYDHGNWCICACKKIV